MTAYLVFYYYLSNFGICIIAEFCSCIVSNVATWMWKKDISSHGLWYTEPNLHYSNLRQVIKATRFLLLFSLLE